MTTYKDYMDEGLENYNYDDFTDAIYNFGMAASVGKNNEEIAEAYFYIGKVYHTSRNDIKQATEFFKKSADYGNKAALQILKAIGVDYAPVKPVASGGTVQKPSPSTASTAQPTKISNDGTIIQGSPSQVYKIGDKGPAGGIVFYDKGNNSDGWRYMEVSPVDLGRTAKWFTERLFNPKVSGAKNDIGAGKRNTELILALCEKKNETDTAAQRCRDYTLNGYKDWFLPSFDELYELRNLSMKPEINGFVNKTYWSSTQTSSGCAWDRAVSRSGVIDSSGGHYGTEKMNFVRAVRYF